MAKRKKSFYFLVTVIILMVAWGIITWWAEMPGKAMLWESGNQHGKKVLIVFDPDPFYNLDELVCKSAGKGFAEENFSVTVASVQAAKQLDTGTYDVFVFCANTYNWRPDWAVTNFIKESPIQNKPVIAITLGAGSTVSSQQALETLITKRGGRLVDSQSLWLMRPNDETRMQEHNVDVAQSIAYAWSIKLARQLGTRQ